MDVFSGDNSLLKKNAFEPLYNITISSNEKFISVNPSLFNGKDISDLQLKNVLRIKKVFFEDKIYNTNSYKIGNFILKPVFFLKNIIKRIN